MLLILTGFLLTACPGLEVKQPDVDSEIIHFDSDSETALVNDTETTNTNPCIDGYLDPTTELCWQLDYSPESMTAIEAPVYCSELSVGDANDWRLARLDELRTLVRDCPSTMPEGACPITDGSFFQDNDHPDCAGCEPLEVPPAGCYWPSELSGDCSFQSFPEGDTDAPAVWGYNFASSTPTADAGTPYTWSIEFHTGRIISKHSLHSAFRVACVNF